MLPLLATLAVLAPQDTGTCAGRVVDVDGSPVAGAEVTFLSRPIPRVLEAGPEDRRVVRSDERGSFRVELPRGRSFTAWASWETRATACAEAVTAGTFVELRGRSDTAPWTLRLVGADAWRPAGPLTLRALVGGEHLDFVTLQRVDDGGEGDDGARYRVPPLPPYEERQIEVLDGRGEVLWCDAVAADVAEPALELAPPREFAVAVVDEAGAPLAGVTVRWHIRNYWYSKGAALPFWHRFRTPMPLVCRTDAAGRGSFRLPLGGASSVWLCSAKDGYRMSLDGVLNGRRFANGEVQEGEQPEPETPFRIVLTKAAPTEIALRDATGRPQARDWLALFCRIKVKRERGGMNGTIMPLLLPVSADGVAALASPLPPATEIENAETLLSAPVRAALLERHGFAPDHWRLPDPRGLEATEPRPDPLSLDGSCVLQVTAADGRPGARAPVWIACDTGDYACRTDRLGRALVPGGEPRPQHVAVMLAGAFAAHEIGGADESIDLQLAPLPKLPVQVVDGRGEAVAGVRVALQNVNRPPADVPAALAWAARELIGAAAAASSDQRGELQLPMPPFPIAVRLRAAGLEAGRDVAWDPDQPGTHTVTVAR